MENTKHTIQIITRLQDNGDGGYTLYGYNSKEELIKDHPNFDKFNSETKEFEFVKPTQEEIDDILNENDPHENGYIGSDSIEIEIVDGQARLVRPISFHAGQ
jgi:hypothetical protein